MSQYMELEADMHYVYIQIKQCKNVKKYLPFRFYMKMKMLHELEIVHENLLAHVTLERHVGLELHSQHVGLSLVKI